MLLQPVPCRHRDFVHSEEGHPAHGFASAADRLQVVADLPVQRRLLHGCRQDPWLRGGTPDEPARPRQLVRQVCVVRLGIASLVPASTYRTGSGHDVAAQPAQRNLKYDLLEHMVLVAARQLLKQKLDIAFGLRESGHARILSHTTDNRRAVGGNVVSPDLLCAVERPPTHDRGGQT